MYQLFARADEIEELLLDSNLCFKHFHHVITREAFNHIVVRDIELDESLVLARILH